MFDKGISALKAFREFANVASENELTGSSSDYLQMSAAYDSYQKWTYVDVNGKWKLGAYIMNGDLQNVSTKKFHVVHSTGITFNNTKKYHIVLIKRKERNGIFRNKCSK